MNFFHIILRTQQIRFPRSRRPAPHVDPGNGSFMADDNGAAGCRCKILCIPQPDALQPVGRTPFASAAAALAIKPPIS